MATPRYGSRRAQLALSTLLASATLLVAGKASAAEPAGASGKTFRFHTETDAIGFTHINPDGDNDNTNIFGFGFGRTTAVDAAGSQPVVFNLARPILSLGLGYVFLEDRAVVGASAAFVFDTNKADDEENDGDDDRVSIVGGQLVPYFRYLFMPGNAIRPYVEGRIGVGGTTTIVSNEGNDDKGTINIVYPVVGLSGGAHIFIIDAFSVDLGLGFDYIAPHVRTESRIGDTTTEDDYEKSADLINLAARAGFSVWF